MNKITYVPNERVSSPTLSHGTIQAEKPLSRDAEARRWAHSCSAIGVITSFSASTHNFECCSFSFGLTNDKI